MPHKLRKIRKTRGSRTQGYGRIGQHRDSGSKGHRKVGRHKHLWSLIVTSEPDYFGKHGFTSPRSLHKVENTLNLQKLTGFTPTVVDGKSTVDLTTLGYTKLLGTGKIANALTVVVPACSKRAQEKITEAGGEVITASQEDGE